MGASIEFFAGAGDDRALREQARLLGLQMVPILWEQRNESLEDPRVYSACYFSFRETEQLHPYGPKSVVTDATDPVIEFTRSFFDPPHLVAGRVYWSDDVEDFGRETKAYFRKIVSWIRKNWRKRDDGYYVGPEAEGLFVAGAIVAYVRSGTAIRRQEI